MLAKENDHYCNSQCGNNGGILFLEKKKKKCSMNAYMCQGAIIMWCNM